jgi:hypothetical protein
MVHRTQPPSPLYLHRTRYPAMDVQAVIHPAVTTNNHISQNGGAPACNTSPLYQVVVGDIQAPGQAQSAPSGSNSSNPASTIGVSRLRTYKERYLKNADVTTISTTAIRLFAIALAGLSYRESVRANMIAMKESCRNHPVSSPVYNTVMNSGSNDSIFV